MRQEREKKNYDIIMNIYSDINNDFYAIENGNKETNEIFQLVIEIEENIVLINKYIKKLNIYELIFNINEVSANTYKNNMKSVKNNIVWIGEHIVKIISYRPIVETTEHENRVQIPPEMWPETDKMRWEDHVKFRAKQALENQTSETETAVNF